MLTEEMGMKFGGFLVEAGAVCFGLWLGHKVFFGEKKDDINKKE